LLDEPADLIAIATVTSVHLPEPGSGGGTRFTLHVEQLLQGTSEVKDLHAYSMFSPPSPKSDFPYLIRSGGPHRTVLDLAAPKVGTLYVIGYSFLYEDGMRACIPGAIDLSDATQARTYLEVQRFLRIRSLAGEVNLRPYIDALDDAVPWIRDLSLQHLVRSNICNATASCVDAVLATVRRLLQNRKLNERFEALEMLKPITQPIGSRMQGPNGLPLMSTPAVREMLVSTLSDSNVALGDKAFYELQLYDFYHAAQPAECIEVIPILRKAAHWTADEAKGQFIGGSFGGGLACTPTQ
jgi:hypothetical protein